MLVLLAGWYFLAEIMTGRKLAGMILAVVGMASYGWLNSRESGTAHKG